MTVDAKLFPGGVARQVRAGDTRFHCVTLGLDRADRPTLLLLHGYPQTHVAWHAVAAAWGDRYRLVIPDLSGYGDSELIGSKSTAVELSKRDVARDLALLMSELDIARYAVIGHDRGARVGYRLALDHPARVTGFVSLTVVPTIDLWDRVDVDFARKAYHWFMLAQPHPLPERLLDGSHAFFIDWTLERMAKGLDRLHPLALAEYRRCFAQSSVRAAMIADYRAAATVDTRHEREDRELGRRLACPMHVLWDADQPTPVPPPMEIWAKWADRVSGSAVPGGHLLHETEPAATVAALDDFLHQLAAST